MSLALATPTWVIPLWLAGFVARTRSADFADSIIPAFGDRSISPTPCISIASKIISASLVVIAFGVRLALVGTSSSSVSSTSASSVVLGTSGSSASATEGNGAWGGAIGSEGLKESEILSIGISISCARSVAIRTSLALCLIDSS